MRRFLWSVSGRRSASLAKHAGPELHEFGLVEVAVLVLVEHLDEVSSHRLIESHLVLDNEGDLVRTQDSIAISVQLVETARYLFVTKPEPIYKRL